MKRSSARTCRTAVYWGSGFHITDYRSDSYKKAAEADKKAAEPRDKPSGEKGPSGSKPSGKSKSDE